MRKPKQVEHPPDVETLFDEGEVLEIVLKPLEGVDPKMSPELVLKRQLARCRADNKSLWGVIWELRIHIDGNAPLKERILTVEGGERVLERLEAAVDGRGGWDEWKRYKLLDEIAHACDQQESQLEPLQEMLQKLKEMDNED